MKREERTVWGITLYRDEEDNANVDNEFVGSEDDLAIAISEAKAAVADRIRRDPRWKLWTATIDTTIEVREQHRLGNLTASSTTYEDAPHGERWSLGPTWQDGPEPW